MAQNSLNALFAKKEQSLEYRAELALARLAIELAGQIRAHREKKGLSQAEFAKLMDSHQSHISRLEDPAYAHYSMLSLAKIADVLGCELKIALSSPQSFDIKSQGGTLKISPDSGVGEPAVTIVKFDFPTKTKAA